MECRERDAFPTLYSQKRDLLRPCSGELEAYSKHQELGENICGQVFNVISKEKANLRRFNLRLFSFSNKYRFQNNMKTLGH